MITEKNIFDEKAHEYDQWFMKNENLLMSEVKLVAKALGSNPKRTLSIGCGSGLFEMILKNNFDIHVSEGIEPSVSMAEIAQSRGMTVKIATAEAAEFGEDEFDTIMFNGSPSYIKNLKYVVEKARKALKNGGRIILIDVAKEGGFATIYNLAMTLNTWEHSLLNDIKPNNPYPVEMLKAANWRTTEKKIELLKLLDFNDITCYQTLTVHPKFANNRIEEPTKGYNAGDYIAVIAHKTA